MRDTIDMAREAGIDAEKDTLCRYEGWLEPLKAFADLVRADEREACAKMIEAAPPLVEFAQNDQGGCLMCGFTPKLAAAAIRARGETK